MHDSYCAAQEKEPEYYDEIEETIDEALGNHFEERFEAVDEIDMEGESNKVCLTPPELSNRGFWDCTNDEYIHKTMCQLNCNNGFHPIGIRLSRVSYLLHVCFLKISLEIQMYV